MTWHLDVALACALYGLFAGQFVPALISRVPEPEPEKDETGGASEAADETPPAEPATPEEPKELYVDMARRRGLRAKASLATAVVAGLLGAAIGWSPAISLALYLAPVGVALTIIDWRTRLLPTKVIAPSYLIVALLAIASAWAESDLDALIRSGLGWLIAGGLFFLTWFIYPKGMGYGDVRLSGILGIALGYLGWGELLVGVYAGFIIGGLGGLLLSLLRIVDRKSLPVRAVHAHRRVGRRAVRAVCRCLVRLTERRVPRERLSPCCAGSQRASPTDPP